MEFHWSRCRTRGFPIELLVEPIVCLHRLEHALPQKKTPTWSNALRAFSHVGLLVNWPPAAADCHSIVFRRPRRTLFTTEGLYDSSLQEQAQASTRVAI